MPRSRLTGDADEADRHARCACRRRAAEDVAAEPVGAAAGTSDRVRSSGPNRWVSMREQPPELVGRALDEEADGDRSLRSSTHEGPAQRDLVDLGAIALRHAGAKSEPPSGRRHEEAQGLRRRVGVLRPREFRRRGRQELGEEPNQIEQHDDDAGRHRELLAAGAFRPSAATGRSPQIASVPTPCAAA